MVVNNAAAVPQNNGSRNSQQLPLILSQPSSATVALGQTAKFTVVARATRPSYQWKRNGAAISGATSSSYTTPAVVASANGTQFTVTVTDFAGSVTSNAATLTVSSGSLGSSGTTATPGVLSASGSTLAFGNVGVGGSSILSVTLTNSGGSNVTIASVTMAGAGFTSSGLSAGQVLAPGQSTTLKVTFAPAAAGSVSGADVKVASNASDSSVTVSLTGTGVNTPTVALNWNTDSTTVTGYNVYRSGSASGPFTAPLNSSLVTATQYVDATVVAGQTYFYAVTAEGSSDDQSGDSNVVSVTVP